MQTTNNNSKNNNLIITAIVAGLIIVSGAFALYGYSNSIEEKKKTETSLVLNKNDDSKMMQETAMSKDSPKDAMSVAMENSGDKMSEPVVTSGTYQNYDQSLLSNAKDGKKVVIFFNASWCSTCQAAVKDINSNLSKIDPKLILLSADYDKETSLKQKYGVTFQHTFVEVDENGNLIKKTFGLSTVDKINNYFIN